jgi:hypothetical protein
MLRLLLCATVGAAMLYGHEVGTTRVEAVFDKGAYRIEVTTDATSLAQKLAAVSGVDLADGASAAEVLALIRRSDATFRRRAAVAFDGVNATPAIEYSAAGAVATIRLTGKIPAGARQFTWKYGWTFASYVMMARNGVKAKPASETLEGNQSSAPFGVEQRRGNWIFGAGLACVLAESLFFILRRFVFDPKALPTGAAVLGDFSPSHADLVEQAAGLGGDNIAALTSGASQLRGRG